MCGTDGAECISAGGGGVEEDTSGKPPADALLGTDGKDIPGCGGWDQPKSAPPL